MKKNVFLLLLFLLVFASLVSCSKVPEQLLTENQPQVSPSGTYVMEYVENTEKYDAKAASFALFTNDENHEKI